MASGASLHAIVPRSHLLSRVQPAGLGEITRMQMAWLFEALWESRGIP